MLLTICTGATAEFRPMIDLLRIRAEMFGYALRLYDLGGLGEGHRWDHGSLDGWTFKPRMILDALHACCGPVLYLDADALPMAQLSGVFAGGGFDVAVTVRDKKELKGKDEDGVAFMGWTNAGVMFFQPTAEARSFVERWAEAMESTGVSDQEALNQILYPDIKWPGHHKMLEHTRPVRVLTLPGSIYNYRADPLRRPGNTKVLHLHSGRWRRFISDLKAFGAPGLAKEVAA